jgi:hypothetical protein
MVLMMIGLWLMCIYWHLIQMESFHTYPPCFLKRIIIGGFGSKWMPKNIPKFGLCSGPDLFHSRHLTYFKAKSKHCPLPRGMSTKENTTYQMHWKLTAWKFPRSGGWLWNPGDKYNATQSLKRKVSRWAWTHATNGMQLNI